MCRPPGLRDTVPFMEVTFTKAAERRYVIAVREHGPQLAGQSQGATASGRTGSETGIGWLGQTPVWTVLDWQIEGFTRDRRSWALGSGALGLPVTRVGYG